jgi:hypothetical protein
MTLEGWRRSSMRLRILRMQRAFLGVFLLTATIIAGGCDNEVDNPSPTDPPPTTTDTFSGTIGVNGAMTHTFNVAVAGRLTATLSAVTPDPAIAVGFALGTWNAASSVCAQSVANDNALQGAIVPAEASGPGTLCVRIYDTGKLTGALNYTISVDHP